MGKKGKEADPDLMGGVYEYDEDALAKMIGLKRHLLQEARESLAGKSAWIVQNGSVVYSREGVERLLKALGCPADSVWTEELLKTSRVDGEWMRTRRGYNRARVSLIPPNRKIVLAMLMDHPERMTVRVIVGDNALYVPGMEMSVRGVSEPDIYEITGSKPRSRGNW